MTARRSIWATSIEVMRAGPLSTVQDGGRHGLRHLGVAQCGALDGLALAVGNRLVGNRPDCAAIEITFGPAVFRFPRATRVALTGAGFDATLDGQRVHAWWSLPVAAGQVLALTPAPHGMRGYLCIAGGIDVLPVLGSRSTDLGAHFGGLAGRALRDGDRLPLGAPHGGPRAPSPDEPAFGVQAPSWARFARVEAPPPVAVAAHGGRAAAHASHAGGTAAAAPRRKPERSRSALAVRVLPGPHYEQFGAAAHAALWNEEWLVTPQSNRMGYRLAGTPLQRAKGEELLSHAVLPGTVQVPPNGQPIVLMHDAQTTGGYPQIGSVLQADLWKLAQARLNGPLRFVQATLADAREALDAEAAYLRQIDAAIALRADIRPTRRPPRQAA